MASWQNFFAPIRCSKRGQEFYIVKRLVIAAIDDLFFISKIRATADYLGAHVRLSRSQQATIKAASELNPSLIIVDLHAKQFDPLALARQLKTDARLRAIPLLGFFSHVQTALMQQAKEAGFDYVMPRSAFSNKLAEILAGKLDE
jgi:PleD family two-component response regulator